MLAEALGKHLHEIRALPNAEVVEWRAFFQVRKVMSDFEAAKRGKPGGD